MTFGNAGGGISHGRPMFYVVPSMAARSVSVRVWTVDLVVNFKSIVGRVGDLVVIYGPLWIDNGKW